MYLNQLRSTPLGGCYQIYAIPQLPFGGDCGEREGIVVRYGVTADGLLTCAAG